MTFEIIKGGLYDEDIPTPEGSYSEWTEEEKEEYRRYTWEVMEPGTVGYAVKNLDVTAEMLTATITTLELIQDVATADAKKVGYNNEWTSIGADELLEFLKLRQKS